MWHVWIHTHVAGELRISFLSLLPTGLRVPYSIRLNVKKKSKLQNQLEINDFNFLLK